VDDVSTVVIYSANIHTIDKISGRGFILRASRREASHAQYFGKGRSNAVKESENVSFSTHPSIGV
jgi:hypothetical protein